MFCKNCGADIYEGSSFCGSCGMTVSNPFREERYNESGLIGFSPKIGDPAFKAYKKKSAAWSLIFTGILAVIAVVGFPIYGNLSGELDWPGSLFYGFAIGGMFILIALLQTLKRILDKTWDGVVTYKDSYTIKQRDRNGHMHHHTYYILKIKKDSGGTKKHKWKDIPGLSGYLNIGDRVRHHKGLSYYEKYDKSKDTRIMCVACMSFPDIKMDICPSCKCPLLKQGK